MSDSFIILWKFRVKKGRETEFEKAYGPEGDWVRFFKKGKGFVKTELYQDANGEYLTVDEWTSKEEYEEFKHVHQKEYRDLDKNFEALTESEVHIGSFVRSQP
ncbi:MAG: hypothetical protein HW374_322 [Bacteroidetes bacterium]|nr:hypothetical protein [Bacteroidota bacterium]